MAVNDLKTKSGFLRFIYDGINDFALFYSERPETVKSALDIASKDKSAFKRKFYPRSLQEKPKDSFYFNRRNKIAKEFIYPFEFRQEDEIKLISESEKNLSSFIFGPKNSYVCYIFKIDSAVASAYGKITISQKHYLVIQVNPSGKNNSDELELKINDVSLYFAISLFYPKSVFVTSVPEYLNEVNYLYLFQLEDIVQKIYRASSKKLKNLKITFKQKNSSQSRYFSTFFFDYLTASITRILKSLNKLDKSISKHIRDGDVSYKTSCSVRETFDKLLNDLNKYFNHIVFENKNEFEISERDDLIFYRGVYCSSYSEQAKVFRNFSSEENEADRYREYKRLFPNCFDGLTHIGCLTQMQHHELATRMLDVTLNPLVALFMACTNEYTKQNSNVPMPLASPFGEVIGYIPQKNNDKDDQCKYYDSIRVTMLASIPLLDFDEKQALLRVLVYLRSLSSKDKPQADSFKRASEIKKCLLTYPLEQKLLDKINKNKTVVKKEEMSSAIDAYHKLTRLVKEECPAFEPDEFDPINLLNAYYVKVGMVNERIIAQSGCFIICGLDKNAIAENLRSTRNTLNYHRIFIANKEMILKELGLLNISKSTMTPDMDHVASTISK